MSLLDNFIVNLTSPPAPEEPGRALIQKNLEKEAIAQNPVNIAYQRMSMEAGLRRPQGVTFATLRRMSRVNWVDRACIKTLTDEITGCPWDIVPLDAKKTYNENLQRFLVLLLTQPNQNKESWRMLMDKTVEDILVCDSGVIEKVRDQKGRISELYYVDGTTIKPCYDIKGMLGAPVAYEQYLPTPTSQLPMAGWSKWDLIRMQWNPSGSIDTFGWGISPVEAGLAVATAFLNAEAYNMSFFQRNTIPPIIINLGEDVPENEVTAFRAYLAAEMSGQQGFWQPFAMAGGKGFDIKQLLKAPQDMAWKEYVEWQMKWKVALYRMSPQDIGFNLDQYKMEGDVQLQLSQNKAINSIKNMIEGYINTEIINDPGWGINPLDINLKFQWIDTDTVDPVDQAQIDKIYWSMGVVENNFIRKERFGLDPIEGGRVPFVIQGATAFALNPKLMDESQGTQSSDSREYDDKDEDEREDDDEDVSKILALPSEKTQVQKIFSPEEGLITDLSMASTAIAWMDDRGVTQPLFLTDFGKTYGFTIKPNFLDEKRKQEPLEGKVAEVLRKLKINTPEVKIMSYDEVLQLIPASLYPMFTKWINVEAPFDSMEWRQRWGNTRKCDYYIVTGFISGKDLGNTELLKALKIAPDNYKNAIRDFARIWLIEKRFFLGDRKPGHYIITNNGNGFGVDYQFFNTEASWRKTSKYLPAILKDLNPALHEYFVQCLIKEYESLDSVEKAFRQRPKNWTSYPQPLELEKKMGTIVQKKINNWSHRAIHVKKKFNSLPIRKSTDFDLDEDWITDGEYVWQYGNKYPISALDDYVNTWWNPDRDYLQPFINSMQKAGLGMTQIAFASLLLLSAQDYMPFIHLGQREAMDHLKQEIPSHLKSTKPVLEMSIYQDRINFLAKTMSQSMKDSMDSILKTGILNNETYGSLHDKLLQALGVNPNDPSSVGWRADRVARTESMWAVREASIQQFEQHGVQYVNLITKETACAHCIGFAQDNPYSLEEARNVGLGNLHPNCYCRWQIETEQFYRVLDEIKEVFAKGWVTMNGKHIYMDKDGGAHYGKDAYETHQRERSGGHGGSGSSGGGATSTSGELNRESYKVHTSSDMKAVNKFEEDHAISLSHDEFKSTQTYQGAASVFINGSHRGNLEPGLASAVPQFNVPTHTKNIDNAIEKSALKEDVVLYHGGKIPSDAKVGSIISDKAYFSTSVLEEPARGFMDPSKGEGMMMVYAPKGTKGLVVNGNSSPTEYNNYTDEHEVIMPRNQSFQVASIRTINSGKSSYRQVELIPVKGK